MKPFWVYIVRCADGSFYTGRTDDLERRWSEHESGEALGFASLRRPLQLAYSEELPSRIEALERELQIKGWTRAKKEALIAGDWLELKRLARRRRHPSTPREPEGSRSAQGERTKGRPGAARR